MPTYLCRAPIELIDRSKKADLAAAITRIHAEVTGADGLFAQVVFAAMAEGDCFLGGRPLSGPQLFVHGHIRAGRSAIERGDLMRRIATAAEGILAVPRTTVWVYISELTARAMIEYGRVLPEPGEEAAWLAGLPDDERRRIIRSFDPASICD